MYFNSVWQYDLTSMSWIPIVSFSMIVLLASIGLMPISIVYATEVMPEKVRRDIQRNIKRNNFHFDLSDPRYWISNITCHVLGNRFRYFEIFCHCKRINWYAQLHIVFRIEFVYGHTLCHLRYA